MTATESQKTWIETGKPEWVGTPFDHKRTIWDILRAGEHLSVEDLERGWKFYAGDQWDDDIKKERYDKGRPALVVNFIQMLVAMAHQNSINAGHVTISAELDRAKAILALENHDAQQLYNYQVSVLAELAQIKPPAAIMDADAVLKKENGTVYVKPSRRLHKNWFVRLLDRVTRWVDSEA